MNTGSSKRRTRHREADLAGLLESAERVFSERGYHATSIRDIARDAGFSVGGVYQFFASKDELYLRVLEGQWEHFFELLTEANRAPRFDDRILGLTQAMFKAFEERQGFFKLFLSERGRLSAQFTGEIAARIGDQTRRLRAHLIELMRQGIAEGRLRAVEPDMLASAYIGIVHNSIFEAMSAGSTQPLRPAFAVLSMFLNGAASPPSTPDAVQASDDE
jgi:AcrR family transcriptional regulator